MRGVGQNARSRTTGLGIKCRGIQTVQRTVPWTWTLPWTWTYNLRYNTWALQMSPPHLWYHVTLFKCRKCKFCNSINSDSIGKQPGY